MSGSRHELDHCQSHSENTMPSENSFTESFWMVRIALSFKLTLSGLSMAISNDLHRVQGNHHLLTANKLLGKGLNFGVSSMVEN